MYGKGIWNIHMLERLACPQLHLEMQWVIISGTK